MVDDYKSFFCKDGTEYADLTPTFLSLYTKSVRIQDKLCDKEDPIKAIQRRTKAVVGKISSSMFPSRNKSNDKYQESADKTVDNKGGDEYGEQ